MQKCHFVQQRREFDHLLNPLAPDTRLRSEQYHALHWLLQRQISFLEGLVGIFAHDRCSIERPNGFLFVNGRRIGTVVLRIPFRCFTQFRICIQLPFLFLHHGEKVL